MSRELDLDVSVPQLRCFLAVVEARSVAEAGRRLGMSAASVSKALTRLEAASGVRLLHRSTHALSLTDAGDALVEPAREAVRAAAAFADRAAAHAADRDGAGVVRVTAAVGLVNHVLVPVLAELGRAHPEIRVDVQVTNKIVDLAEGGIDIAIRTGPFTGLSGHLRQAWFVSPWVFCATPAYLKKRARPKKIADLDGHDLIGFRNTRTGRVAPWPYRDGAYEPKSRLTFDDGNAGWAAALAGAGILCVPLYMAAPALRTGDVVELLAPFRDAPVSVAMLRRERRLTPNRVKKVLAFLTAHAPDLSDLL